MEIAVTVLGPRKIRTFWETEVDFKEFVIVGFRSILYGDPKSVTAISICSRQLKFTQYE